MPSLPTITEIVDTLRQVRSQPGSLTRSECEPLFTVLRAAYDDKLEDQYEALDDQYVDVTEGADNLLQDAVIAISQLPCSFANDRVPELITFLDSDDQFYELAHALVALTFPITSSVAKVHNNLQRDVLAAVIANDDIWDSDAMFADYLKPRGLPNNRWKIEALLTNAD